MTIPTINAYINFSTGPSFAQAMILDQGILDTNVLADAAAVIVDVSDVVDSINTRRGRMPKLTNFKPARSHCALLTKMAISTQ
jgi:hypothetical protein